MWNTLANEAIVKKTIRALEKNNIHALVVDNGKEVLKTFLKLIPAGSQVFAMSSITLQATGVTDQVDRSGRYDSVRKRIMSMKRETQGTEIRKLGAAPNWAVGSVQAVTQDGQLIIASKTGSQLAAYASGAEHVVFVAGTHKIVKNREEGFRRVYEHSLKLENKRALKVYGVESEVEKILILAKEFKPGRTTLIFVKEVFGF